jgi:hypothetical protein
VYNAFERAITFEVKDRLPANFLMSRLVTFLAFIVAICGIAAWPGYAQPPREQIELTNHTRYSGLIESEDSDWLTLIRIQTPAGRPMHLVIQPFDRQQILSITRLDADQRAALQKQIEDFRNRATIEAVRMEAIRLTVSHGEGCNYRHYQSKWFMLDSTADEQDTRRVVVRAEQIFAAYRQIMPPRAAPARPLRLIVLGSMSEYQAALALLGVKAKIQNPACFVEDCNTVVIGSDMIRFASVASQMHAQNAGLRRDLRDLEDRLNERLRAVGDSLRKSGLSNVEVAHELTRERSKFQQQRDKKLDQLRQSDVQIDHLKQTADQMFVRLYHESFHAYVRNWVFPRPQYDIPAWLDEGLAVLFEGGLLEGDTLRVDSPNLAALKKLKADMAGASPLGLQELLAASPANFLILAASRPAAVDRYYVNAWGLAYYLTFEKRVLNSPALERYLRSESARLSPADRFQLLVGMPPAQLEEQWRAYIAGL